MEYDPFNVRDTVEAAALWSAIHAAGPYKFSTIAALNRRALDDSRPAFPDGWDL